jgi:hypothetical protein
MTKYFPVIVEGRDAPIFYKIDAEDESRLKEKNWHMGNGYPVRSILMHEKETGLPSNHKEKMTDFILGEMGVDGVDAKFLNGDKKDYRKSNLRLVRNHRRILGSKANKNFKRTYLLND